MHYEFKFDKHHRAKVSLLKMIISQNYHFLDKVLKYENLMEELSIIFEMIGNPYNSTLGVMLNLNIEK